MDLGFAAVKLHIARIIVVFLDIEGFGVQCYSQAGLRFCRFRLWSSHYGIQVIGRGLELVDVNVVG